MGLMQYFSKDEDKRAKFIFNLIAPVYYLIDKGTQDNYREMATLLNKQLPLEGQDILDVGCGTGSWISTLANYSPRKTYGSDFSEKMLKQATKRFPNLECKPQTDESLSVFDDNSFDIVTSTFVMHGMKKEKRSAMLEEMKRVARDFVVIHDFYKGSSLMVSLLEFLERSDYINFKKHFNDEMKQAFTEVTIVEGVKGNALYIGKI